MTKQVPVKEEVKQEAQEEAKEETKEKNKEENKVKLQIIAGLIKYGFGYLVRYAEREGKKMQEKQ